MRREGLPLRPRELELYIVHSRNNVAIGFRENSEFISQYFDGFLYFLRRFIKSKYDVFGKDWDTVFYYLDSTKVLPEPFLEGVVQAAAILKHIIIEIKKSDDSGKNARIANLILETFMGRLESGEFEERLRII